MARWNSACSTPSWTPMNWPSSILRVLSYFISFSQKNQALLVCAYLLGQIFDCCEEQRGGIFFVHRSSCFTAPVDKRATEKGASLCRSKCHAGKAANQGNSSILLPRKKASFGHSCLYHHTPEPPPKGFWLSQNYLRPGDGGRSKHRQEWSEIALRCMPEVMLRGDDTGKSREQRAPLAACSITSWNSRPSLAV